MNEASEPVGNKQNDADVDAHRDDAEQQQQADHDDTSDQLGAHPTGERQAAENAENELPG